MNTRLDAFRIAIQNEMLSQKIYLMLAGSFQKNPAVATTLSNLVPLEKIHEEKLRNAFSAEFPAESLILDASTVHQITPEDINDPVKVLEFAISRELIAAALYKKLAAETKDLNFRNLMNELASEEDNHKTVLETEILRLDGLMTWYDPSELSGLVED